MRRRARAAIAPWERRDVPAIELVGVTRSFPVDDPDGGTPTVRALDGVDLTIGRGELVAVIGASGSGKSTLLYCCGGLDQPTEGAVRVHGEHLAKLSPAARARLRNRTIGFVFQAFNLVPGLSAAENVALPGILARLDAGALRARVDHLLDVVDLTRQANRLPGQLSGGEQQRVAVARALLLDPPVVLADEPTGNLDSRAGEVVLDLLLASHDGGRTVVLVTHDHRVAAQAERVVHLCDGRITHEIRPDRGPDRRLAELLDVGDAGPQG